MVREFIFLINQRSYRKESESIEIDLWVKFDGKAMYEQKEAVDSGEPIFVPGTLLSDLQPFYQNTTGTRIEVLFSEWSYDADSVEFIAVEHMELMQDQRTPMERGRILETMQRIHHSQFMNTPDIEYQES